MTTLHQVSRSAAPVKSFLAFLALFGLLYVIAVLAAERHLRASPPDGALQRLSAYDDTQVDWLVIGASHTLPLLYGDIPGRLSQDTGQSMLVLGEVGAGPVLTSFILDRAFQELEVGHVLYIVDSFAFASRDWNEARFSDRKLLARMPINFSTARLLAERTAEGQVPLVALADYLTGFSKLNPVERFPAEGWRGAADFDKAHRPSRHAVAARIKYLYPESASDAEVVANYLATLAMMVDRAQAAGTAVTVLKPPVPDAFAKALPKEGEFDATLGSFLEEKKAPFLNFSGSIPENEYYFDTDHLNRQGVDLFYERALKGLLTARP
ncbi:MAG: hypothetical protein QNJ20_03485 [Paracoccaceae bacterium]|nr:hypothetical protein [Paracoccaceae bacterium]